MAKKMKSLENQEQQLVLPPEVAEAFAEFLRCTSPRHFKRALRDSMFDLVASNRHSQPDYGYELFMGLPSLFAALDAAADTGKYNDKRIEDM